MKSSPLSTSLAMQLPDTAKTTITTAILLLTQVHAIPSTGGSQISAREDCYTAPKASEHPLTCMQGCKIQSNPKWCTITADIEACQPNGNSFIVWDSRCTIATARQKSFVLGSSDISLWVPNAWSVDVHLDTKTFDYADKKGLSYVSQNSNYPAGWCFRDSLCEGGHSYTIKFQCQN